jgi:GPI mannosyltransferase 3
VIYMQKFFPPKVDPHFPPSPSPASPAGVPNITPYPWTHEWPRHLVFFGALLEDEGMRDLFTSSGYKEVYTAGRSWEGDGDNRKGGVRVWRWGA